MSCPVCDGKSWEGTLEDREYCQNCGYSRPALSYIDILDYRMVLGRPVFSGAFVRKLKAMGVWSD